MIRLMIRHELRLVLREPRFWIPFLLPPAFLIAAELFLFAGIENGAGLPSIHLFLVAMVGVLLSSMVVNLVSDSFAGERERGSLETLLVQPVSIEAVFFGKLAAALPLPIVLAWLAQLLLWLLQRQQGFALEVLPLFLCLGISASTAIFLATVSLSFSLLVRTARSASQLSIFVLLLLLFSFQIFGEELLGSITLWCLSVVGMILFAAVLAGASFRRFRSRGID